jgi:hypothetical protein
MEMLPLMDTRFGLRRYLLLTFPEIRAATVTVDASFSLIVRYVPSTDELPDHGAVTAWVDKNRTAGAYCQVMRVAKIDDADMPEALLAGSTMSLAIAEDAAINLGGINDHMRRRWPDHFVRLDDGVRPGCVECVVSAEASDDTKASMQGELSLLLHGASVDILVDTSRAIRPHATSRAELALSEDWDRMNGLCDVAMDGSFKPTELPPGVYASTWSRQSLFSHLAIAERVYVQVPPKIDEMDVRYDVSWVDFLDAMSTSRVVPVFRFPERRYEPGMIDAALDAGGMCILPGDNRLRELAAFSQELPLLALASRLDDDWRFHDEDVGPDCLCDC